MYFIRHGFSCANATHNNNSDVLHHRKYLDPALANTGVSDSKSMSGVTKKLKYDVVCASTLNRAIETALLMFPNDTIHVIPYAKEIRKTQDNTAQPIRSKKSFFKKMYPNDYHRIDFSKVNDEIRNKWSFTKCMRFVRTTFGDSKVALVTHSLYMVHYLKIPMEPFPLNNCIYEYNDRVIKKIHDGKDAYMNGEICVSRCKTNKNE
jgi:broad specificity phosphatase PhoE